MLDINHLLYMKYVCYIKMLIILLILITSLTCWVVKAESLKLQKGQAMS